MDKKQNIGGYVTAYILGAIALTLGILVCVFSNNSGFHKAIIMTVGIIMVVVASIDLLIHIRDVFRVKAVDTSVLDYHRSVMTAFSLAFGIIVIIVANDITDNPGYASIIFDYVSLLIGISFIVVGTTALLKGIIFLARKYPNKDRNIYRVVGGIVLVVAGILVLCLVYPASVDTVFQIFFLVLGIYIIIFALAILLVTTNTLILHKRLEKLGDEMIEEMNKDHEEEPIDNPDDGNND